ncbi:MAG: AmmeMemoRadiSam system radical SAM enzyme [Candidatus Krumholzibacteriota bacterium]|nr:AmmeMemoRadiSam system radical SAM enzyme [Candidatus Krumholzibacteriota bacterium]
MEPKKARYYEQTGDGAVVCRLCPNRCRIPDGGRGRCRLRENRGGVLLARSWGRTVTAAIDPIEKKPLYHFLPGSRILSIGPNGCTLACRNCQNWSISQEKSPTSLIEPADLVELAGRDGSVGVAFTYTEPLLWFEYLLDAAPLLRDAGLKTVLVTNGYLEEEPARELAPLVDAFNIDLKSMDDGFYGEMCGGAVEPVKRFIEIAAAVSHVEVTNLLVPGLNDGDGQIEALAAWVAGVSREIPVHFSRFFPVYRMTDRPPTPPKRLEAAYAIAKRHLDHVYIGNIHVEGAGDTYCPSCGAVVVERRGYATGPVPPGGLCPSCGAAIKGVWST